MRTHRGELFESRIAAEVRTFALNSSPAFLYAGKFAIADRALDYIAYVRPCDGGLSSGEALDRLSEQLGGLLRLARDARLHESAERL
jgi:hypothetical protein